MMIEKIDFRLLGLKGLKKVRVQLLWFEKLKILDSLPRILVLFGKFLLSQTKMRNRTV